MTGGFNKAREVIGWLLERDPDVQVTHSWSVFGVSTAAHAEHHMQRHSFWDNEYYVKFPVIIDDDNLFVMFKLCFGEFITMEV